MVCVQKCYRSGCLFCLFVTVCLSPCLVTFTGADVYCVFGMGGQCGVHAPCMEYLAQLSVFKGKRILCLTCNVRVVQATSMYSTSRPGQLSHHIYMYKYGVRACQNPCPKHAWKLEGQYSLSCPATHKLIFMV